MLSLSDSEELDAKRQMGASADQPSQSVAFEELLEVMTRAVDKLNLKWPDKKRCHAI